MKSFAQQIQSLIPDIQLEHGADFFWSPAHKLITYNPELLGETAGQWALIHEAAHALLGHSSYDYDYDLLVLEVATWKKAEEVAGPLGITIDPEHIQDCLDTYRDWLHQRATCPGCSTVSLQTSVNRYTCHNCHTGWQVSTSRFCRPYRLRNARPIKKSPGVVQTTFA